jgi:hypothetical protein
LVEAIEGRLLVWVEVCWVFLNLGAEKMPCAVDLFDTETVLFRESNDVVVDFPCVGRGVKE